jgi:hypothetical protein
MVCEVCGFEGVIFKDHCHMSGQFRGMLCNSCNVILSNYDDDPNILRARAEFLRAQPKLVADDNLYSRLQKAKIEYNKARANILDALAEYLSRS